MPTKRGNHCAYSIHYHIVFPVKYRKALLEAPIVATLKLVTKELEERYEFEMEEIGCDLNHIHLLTSFHPKYSIGQFVRLYKSITAREQDNWDLDHPDHRYLHFGTRESHNLNKRKTIARTH